MQIELSCEIIGRLALVNRSLPQNENRKWLQSIFIEQTSDGYVYAGATNSKFASVQLIGIQRPVDPGFVVVRHDGAWLDAVHSSDPDMTCKITDWAEMNFCTLEAPNGFKSSGDAAIRDPEAISTLKKWRNWFPDELPTEPGRAVFLDIDGMQNLVDSSPSGCVVFPKIIDANKAIIVRDLYNPSWIGVFLGQPQTGIFLHGAQLPDWVK